MEIKNYLVILDLETTGLWVDKDKIVEIAMVKCSPDGGKEEYQKRVNPGIHIPQVVSDLIGIYNEDVKDAPLFKDIAQEVQEFIGDADLAGFNSDRFDLPVLERELREAGYKFDWRLRKTFDAQKVYHINEKRDLTSAYKFYCNKSLENAHSALADTLATVQIIESQIKKYGNGSEDISVLDAFEYQVDSDFFDEERKFRWWNGKLYMMFGKYARKYSLQEIVKKDRNYLEWIISSNFSDEVKTLVEDALVGKFPVASSVNVN